MPAERLPLSRLSLITDRRCLRSLVSPLDHRKSRTAGKPCGRPLPPRCPPTYTCEQAIRAPLSEGDLAMSSGSSAYLPCQVLALVLTICLARDVLRAAERNTPTPFRIGRSVTMAPHGMVATSHPLAVQVGLDVLKRGGNAVDAAIATNAAMGLMEPMSCGIGGDLYAIVWDANSQKLYGLNASGRSPYKATRTWFVEHDYKAIPTTGPLSWSVPGCVDGWDELRKRFGTKPLAELLEPSIRYAENGF